jgi:2-methylisocitrate lyase-like PEP mutase family enzyme
MPRLDREAPDFQLLGVQSRHGRRRLRSAVAHLSHVQLPNANGHRAVLYALTAFRPAMKAAEETLTTLRQAGHQRGLLGRIQTRAE